MTPVAKVTFALLVVATGAAFFVTQRLKRSTPVVTAAHFRPIVFSPNGDGRRDSTRLSFRLKRSDDVTVSIVSAHGGDVVRELAVNVSVPARRRFVVRWDGRQDGGRLAPDGVYLARVGLRHEGRSLVLPPYTVVDTRPVHPVIVAVNGRRASRARSPLMLTAGRPHPLRVRIARSTGRRSELDIVRVDGAAPRIVARAYGRRRRHVIVWDGLVGGRPAPPGTYRLRVVEVDLGGNRGVSSPRAPGIGFEVRGVTLAPPLSPVRAGTRATVRVDARGRPWRWALRHVGGDRPVSRGRGRGTVLRVRLPRGRTALYVLSVRAGAYGARVPIAAAGPHRARVLVVLPALRWVGTAALDEDGDGVPDTVDAGGPVPLDRPFPSLPKGFATQEGPLIAHLDTLPGGYELTTDAAVARHPARALAGHAGVLFAGSEPWLPPAVLTAVRRYVAGGGRVATFGVDTLDRDVLLLADRITRPGRRRRVDALGARPGPVQRRPTELSPGTDAVGLFPAGAMLAGWREWQSYGVPALGGLVAAATPTPMGSGSVAVPPPVIVAYHLGGGLAIRVGLSGWGARIASDPAVAAVTDQAWRLLSG